MPVQASVSHDGHTLTIAVSGEFQFSVHREFRDAYLGFTQKGAKIGVNLAGTTYMDSSALGMLMLMHEHVKKYEQQATLQSPQPAIRRILEIASFDRLFPIV